VARARASCGRAGHEVRRLTPLPCPWWAVGSRDGGERFIKKRPRLAEGLVALDTDSMGAQQQLLLRAAKKRRREEEAAAVLPLRLVWQQGKWRYAPARRAAPSRAGVSLRERAVERPCHPVLCRCHRRLA